MKNKILDILYKNNGKFVSGQDICNKLGVSRTAVWKHIKTLIADGYPIESTGGKGYILKGNADILNKYEIMRRLKKDAPLFFEKTVESTNTEAKSIAVGVEEDFSVFIASKQKGGRGRLGRRFESDNEKGIWCSFILKPEITPERALVITIAAAIAVCGTLGELYGIKPGIKWPNDIILNKKKVCGILSEMSCETGAVNFIITGIGLNVSQEKKDFSPEISNTASSMFMETGVILARAEIISSLCYNMQEAFGKVKENNTGWLMNKWKKYSVTDGKMVRLIKKEDNITALAETIDEYGRLIIVDEKGNKTIYNSGEISVRGIMGYI